MQEKYISIKSKNHQLIPNVQGKLQHHYQRQNLKCQEMDKQFNVLLVTSHHRTLKLNVLMTENIPPLINIEIVNDVPVHTSLVSSGEILVDTAPVRALVDDQPRCSHDNAQKPAVSKRVLSDNVSYEGEMEMMEIHQLERIRKKLDEFRTFEKFNWKIILRIFFIVILHRFDLVEKYVTMMIKILKWLDLTIQPDRGLNWETLRT
ncbi:uncharacterized protein LOC107035931 [Diachasma alloeum]|uniref:uncharacterized protein LOC107035931 n=1 Tax=Diachasma alloeum TaxID=454923 RepID=UPI000738482D|nr:uncharacterized protein LOC107035931 [Diachasma alloeum]